MTQPLGGVPPAPLEWHPYYRDKTHLLDWLKPATLTPVGVDRSGAVVYELPIAPPARVDWDADPDPLRPSPNTVTLVKHKASGPAPWTERPYRYVWYVGTDQYGRSIAGESWIEEIPVMPWTLP